MIGAASQAFVASLPVLCWQVDIVEEAQRRGVAADWTLADSRSHLTSASGFDAQRTRSGPHVNKEPSVPVTAMQIGDGVEAAIVAVVQEPENETVPASTKGQRFA